MKYDIFISYRRDGGAQYARILQLMLQQMGYKVFLDYDELTDGIFGDHIKQAIKEATIFMIILSPKSMDRCINENDWLRQEIMLAIEEQKHIIPINPDGTFRGLSDVDRDKMPAEIINIVNNYQHSEIGFGQTLWVTLELMVKMRIAPKLGERQRVHNKQDIDDIKRLSSSINGDKKRKFGWIAVVAVLLVVLLSGTHLLWNKKSEGGRELVLSDHTNILRTELQERYKSLNLYLSPNLTDTQLYAIESILCNMREVKSVGIWINQFEFNKAQWYGVQNEKYDQDDALCPMTNVSYGEIYMFITKLCNMTNIFFELPSVAEWQMVARGGDSDEGTLYVGDDDVNLVAWYSANSGGVVHPSDGQQGMAPNGLDMYDMSGNVAELCNTTYEGNPAIYTVCGGSYMSSKEDVTIASTMPFGVESKDETVGFRVIIRPNYN